MSLRRDVHSVFDSIAPPLGGMPERVVQTALADKGRRRKERIMSRVRAPLSLVAVFLLIALVVAVLVGSKLVNDWNAKHRGTPAGQVNPQQFAAQLAQIEQRPFRVTAYTSTQNCPNTGNAVSGLYQFGSPPVFADGGSPRSSAWGTFFDVAYFTDPHLTGPVLIRGSDRNGHAVVFTGDGAYGPVIANDPGQTSPQLHAELVIDAGHPQLRENGYGVFSVRQGLPKTAGPCFGFQIDGPSFEEIFTG